MFTLGRSVDIHYPTNRLILILAAITAVIGSFTSGSFVTGLKIGATIFVTWALSRELDPKREYGAFASVALALYSFFICFEVALMELFFFILILRLISTTTGKQTTWFDVLTVLGVSGYLTYSSDNLIYILLSIVGIFISGAIRNNILLHRALTLLAGGSIGYILSMFFVDATYNVPILSFSTVLIIAVAYTLLAYFDWKRGPKIYDDENNEIRPTNIFKSQLFFVIGFLLIALFSDLVIGNMIIYISSLIGLTLYGILSQIMKIEDE